ncbi:hypothetical protein M1M14_gp077 [Synechococcus phage ACG-2014e]|uniref:Uncharacterized protein n=1 Tax=Synechococcus phage ACG-2014e TaxID=1493510 RepID=A0A0E3F577_9CAUD|nr:hypothetical protein M1M14_gp077 [Synechococcus phage ACG-2014e]AIX20540.1 hypothetical protein Syn7803C85_77 [Synechococcus phage ACG-2014e]
MSVTGLSAISDNLIILHPDPVPPDTPIPGTNVTLVINSGNAGSGHPPVACTVIVSAGLIVSYNIGFGAILAIS